MTDLPKIETYKNLSLVVKGPYWTLYEAIQKDTESRHLLQVLDPQLSSDRNLLHEFENLRHYNRVLSHPSILVPQKLETLNNYHILVYEHFQAQSLRQMFDSKIPVLERQVVSLATHSASALQYAQIRGIKHGWLLPENILLSKYSDEIKLFGFASEHFFEQLYASDKQKKLRIAEYLTPESLAAHETPETDDAYALGVILYKSLSSKDPFPGNSMQDLRRVKQQPVKPPHEINPKLSPNVSQLVTSLIDPFPQKRTTLGTLLNYLAPEPENEVAEEESAPAFNVGPMKRGLSFLPKSIVGSKRRIAYSVITALIFLSVLASVMVFTQLSTSNAKRIQLAYEEFIAEGRRQADKAPVTEPDVEEFNENDTLFERNSPPLDTLENEPEDNSTQPPPVQESSTSEEAIKPEPEPAPVPKTTTLRLSAYAEDQPVDAHVWINGDSIGDLSANGLLEIPDLNIGSSYTVKVQKSGFEPWETTVRLQQAPVTSVRADLKQEEKLSKVVTIAAVPFATHIQLEDGQVFKLPATLDLTFGSHLINFIDRDVEFLWRTEIQVDETSPEKIVIDPESVGTGELLVVLENPIEYGYAYVSVDGNPEHTTPYKYPLSAGQHRVRIFRQGYKLSPADTTVFIKPNEETILRCLVE